ncbi:hypothetical protein MLD38_003179 [Melastoma candidum]|uniref:Uncharacterized protein n=1 Tax=Melastoma candidum TaxID=119954 RepID=A0ACB9S3Q8_9MYRT|nr:hypothetical protein MLD38_003179 [Melastoma candidum]
MRPATVLFAFMLFLAVGSELKTMNAADAQCQDALWGGGCEEKSCNAACVKQYGSDAYGLCFFYKKPSDTCLCRHKCQSV